MNLADPGGHAWVSGTVAKVAAAAKKTTSKSGAVKSGAANVLRNSALDAAGLARGIGQAITDIWNKSMSVSPIGKIFLNQGKKTAPDGLHQTGKGFPGVKDSLSHNDGSTVEFLGLNIKENTVNLTNNYQIMKIIVYEGVLSAGQK